MTPEDLVKQAKRITKNHVNGHAALTEAMEFLRVYGGANNSFVKHLKTIETKWSDHHVFDHVVNTMNGFIAYVQNGLLDGVSIERKAQLDVVSDFLDQANTLLNSSKVHPAAPTVIIGAALEEFLRNWIEEECLSLSEKKPSLDAYAKVLRENELISKQDVKDITSWGGLRNHAAHGEWEEVQDKGRITIMLEGVNLFMRKYGAKTI